jgi:hypothetical protein
MATVGPTPSSREEAATSRSETAAPSAGGESRRRRAVLSPPASTRRRGCRQPAAVLSRPPSACTRGVLDHVPRRGPGLDKPPPAGPRPPAHRGPPSRGGTDGREAVGRGRPVGTASLTSSIRAEPRGPPRLPWSSARRGGSKWAARQPRRRRSGWGRLDEFWEKQGSPDETVLWSCAEGPVAQRLLPLPRRNRALTAQADRPPVVGPSLGEAQTDPGALTGPMLPPASAGGTSGASRHHGREGCSSPCLLAPDVLGSVTARQGPSSIRGACPLDVRGRRNSGHVSWHNDTSAGPQATSGLEGGLSAMRCQSRLGGPRPSWMSSRAAPAAMCVDVRDAAPAAKRGGPRREAAGRRACGQATTAAAGLAPRRRAHGGQRPARGRRAKAEAGRSGGLLRPSAGRPGGTACSGRSGAAEQSGGARSAAAEHTPRARIAGEFIAIVGQHESRGAGGGSMGGTAGGTTTRPEQRRRAVGPDPRAASPSIALHGRAPVELVEAPTSPSSSRRATPANTEKPHAKPRPHPRRRRPHQVGTEFGAKGDDMGDDTTPSPGRAIEATDGVLLVPAGRYVLTKQLFIKKSNFVLRGEGKGKTILYFPRPLSEVGSPAPAGRFNGGFLTVTAPTTARSSASSPPTRPHGAHKLQVVGHHRRQGRRLGARHPDRQGRTFSAPSTAACTQATWPRTAAPRSSASTPSDRRRRRQHHPRAHAALPGRHQLDARSARGDADACARSGSSTSPWRWPPSATPATSWSAATTASTYVGAHRHLGPRRAAAQRRAGHQHLPQLLRHRDRRRARRHRRRAARSATTGSTRPRRRLLVHPLSR